MEEVRAFFESDLAPHRLSELIRLLVLTFFGGTLDALAMKAFFTSYAPIIGSVFSVPNETIANATVRTALSTPDYGYSLLLSIIALFFLPLILSFLFGRRARDRIIVSPTYMQGIAYALLLFFAWSSFTPYDWVSIIWGFMYVGFSSPAQDRLMITALGKAAPRDAFLKLSLSVETSVPNAIAILQRRKYREQMGLDTHVTTTDRGSSMLRPKRGKGLRTALEFVEGQSERQTLLNVVYFLVGTYEVTISDTLREYARSQSAYLEAILNSSEFALHPTIADEQNADYLVDMMVDEMQGVFRRFAELPFRRAIIIVAIVVMFVVSGLGFLLGRSEIGWAALGIVAYIAYEEFRRSGE
jgi:hypothetical protein